GDVRATTFTPTQLELMEELVSKHGGSFILLAGHKHTPGEYADTPIARMLPVEVAPGPWEDVSDGAYPALTDEGQQSSVMTLDPNEAENKALWANVKPLERVPPVAGAKLGAKVLAALS